jgi:hypothetical protein
MGRRAAEAAAKKAQDDLEDERKRTELEKAGEYEEAKKSLVENLATVTGERDALAAKVARYETIAKEQVESLKKDIPAEALAKFPDDGDPLDQLAWLEDRAALVKVLRPNGKVKSGGALAKTPAADLDAPELDDEKALAANARRYQNF